MKISLIMASYLDGYENCAGRRREKFRRAVDSFLEQTYTNAELIIIADGCKITEDIYRKKYAEHKNILLLPIAKQELFSGQVRQQGIELASGQIIGYLDTDDFIGKDHLKHIKENFDTTTYDWVYFNDYLKYNYIEHLYPTQRNCIIEQGSIGTSNIAHKNKPLQFNWTNCDGYGHDYKFITEKLYVEGTTHTKIGAAEYFVCHVPGSVDV